MVQKHHKAVPCLACEGKGFNAHHSCNFCKGSGRFVKPTIGRIRWLAKAMHHTGVVLTVCTANKPKTAIKRAKQHFERFRNAWDESTLEVVRVSEGHK